MNDADLIFAAGLVNRGRRGPIDPRRLAAGSALVQRRAASAAADPLEARLIDYMLAEETSQRERSTSREDEQSKWDRALKLQETAHQREGERLRTAHDYRLDELRLAGDQTAAERAARREAAERAALQQAGMAQYRETGEWPGFAAPVLPGVPTGGGTGMNREQGQALANEAMHAIIGKLGDETMTPEDAAAALGRLRDPAEALRALTPPAGAAPQKRLVDVVQANYNMARTGTGGVSAEDLFGDDGFGGNPELASARDAVIGRLLTQGHTPDQIGTMAQLAVDPLSQGHSIGWFGGVNRTKESNKRYADLWIRRAYQIKAGQMAPRPVAPPG